jgi:uncharacterized protein YndB with AHSA1/START domain
MSVLLPLLLAATVATTPPTHTAASPAGSRVDGAVTVTLAAQPEKALLFEVLVPASLHDTWTAMTTSDGLTTWLTPQAKVDLRPGGDWLAMWGANVAPGGGTIVAFEPEQSITIRAMAPESFPTVRRERTVALFSFSAVDAHTTRVTLRQTGWKQGEEWDKAYTYLARGNAMLLNALRQRFVTGPTDWAAAMKSAK